MQDEISQLVIALCMYVGNFLQKAALKYGLLRKFQLKKKTSKGSSETPDL